eukprot:220410-Hanusia_phi.AAC.1
MSQGTMARPGAARLRRVPSAPGGPICHHRRQPSSVGKRPPVAQVGGTQTQHVPLLHPSF